MRERGRRESERERRSGRVRVKHRGSGRVRERGRGSGRVTDGEGERDGGWERERERRERMIVR